MHSCAVDWWLLKMVNRLTKDFKEGQKENKWSKTNRHSNRTKDDNNFAVLIRSFLAVHERCKLAPIDDVPYFEFFQMKQVKFLYKKRYTFECYRMSNIVCFDSPEYLIRTTHNDKCFWRHSNKTFKGNDS